MVQHGEAETSIGTIEEIDENTCAEANTFEPSAPTIEEEEEEKKENIVVENDKKQEKSLYPTLKPLQTMEMPSPFRHLIRKERIILQPFTKAQLKELYHNTEILLAETFENDFINTELNTSYRDYPLYDLIKKYSQSRYNLKINMLDLQGYIKSFQENSQNVWKIENRVTWYDGMCADGERISKMESYE